MDLGDARNWVFLVIALVMLAAGFRVVTSRNVVHAALLLVVTLAGSAALFLLLGAEFIAWVVVLVYIGAVVVLFLFGVMITRAPIGSMSATDHARRWPAALIALATFALTAGTAVSFFEDSKIDLESPVRVRQIGDALFERWVIPFEAVSFLLLAALIGGIVLARRDVQR